MAKESQLFSLFDQCLLSPLSLSPSQSHADGTDDFITCGGYMCPDNEETQSDAEKVSSAYCTKIHKDNGNDQSKETVTAGLESLSIDEV